MYDPYDKDWFYKELKKKYLFDEERNEEKYFYNYQKEFLNNLEKYMPSETTADTTKTEAKEGPTPKKKKAKKKAKSAASKRDSLKEQLEAARKEHSELTGITPTLKGDPKKDEKKKDKKSAPELSFKVGKIDNSIIWPETDKNFYVGAGDAQCLGVLEEMSVDNPQNVLLTGPQGCGKTELAIWFAAKYKRPCVLMNCAVIRENKDWFGYKDAKGGSVFWHKADFVRALEMGNCVILLDEFNRLHSTLHNALYPLLDARRATYVEEIGEQIEVGPKTVFFATANIGFNHTGTFTMDAAIEDRFGIRIEVDFLEKAQETNILMKKTGLEKTDADRLCRFAADVRRKSRGLSASLARAVSTRQLLQTAVLAKKMMDQGIPIKKALDYTVVPFYSKEGGTDSEQAVVLQLIQGIFG